MQRSMFPETDISHTVGGGWEVSLRRLRQLERGRAPTADVL